MGVVCLGKQGMTDSGTAWRRERARERVEFSRGEQEAQWQNLGEGDGN